MRNRINYLRTSHLSRKLYIFAAIIYLAVGCFMPVVSADEYKPETLPESELKAIDDYPEWVGVCGSEVNSPDQATDLSKKSDEGGDIYILGDSITAIAQDVYKDKFKSPWKPTVEGLSSRHINSSPPSPSGIGQVAKDKDKIKDAKVVVIALGTNDTGNSADSIKKNVASLVKDVRDVNKSAPLYWVNVINTKHDADSKKTNKAIKEGLGEDSKNKVIDWYSKAKDNAGLASFNEGVHPTSSKDINLLVNTVYDSVTATALPVSYDTEEGGGTDATSSDFTAPTDLKQKIAQMLFIGTPDNSLATTLAEKYGIGGVLLDTGSTYTSESINRIKAASKIPVFIAVDNEGGQVQRLKDVVGDFPSAKEMGKMTSASIESKGKSMAQKMSDIGVDVDFAPVLDLDDGRNTAISTSDRSFSSSASKVTSAGKAFAKGLNEGGVVPTFKHFPGLGKATGVTGGNTDTGPATSPKLEDLFDSDLKPYNKILSDFDRAMVMMGNQKVPDLTDDQPASLSPKAYKLLREDFGYKGIVVTDELANAKAITSGSVSDAVKLAIKSGADMPLIKVTGETAVNSVINNVADAVDDGDISITDIDNSLGRIMKLKSTSTDKPAKEAKTCQCEQPNNNSGSLEGKDNREKIWNYLYGKKPEGGDKALTAIQTAGIMGNLQEESTFNPRAYNPQTTTDDPVPSHAFGIAQWLGPRQTALKDFAKKADTDITDMKMQLDFLWNELTHGEFKINVLDPILSTSDLTRIADVWNNKFEKSGAPTGPRVANATRILSELGSGGGPASDGSSDAATPQQVDCKDSTGESTGEVVLGYALPLAKKFYTQNPAGFKGPHHDYSAVDIPVPSGNTVYAAADGKVTSAPVGGGCGQGVIITGDDGLFYMYCHGSDGGSIRGAKQGDTVKAGQPIMHSDNTGTSTGPHLHFEIRVNGEKRCPQNFLVGIATGNPVNPKTLPSSGCSY